MALINIEDEIYGDYRLKLNSELAPIIKALPSSLISSIPLSSNKKDGNNERSFQDFLLHSSPRNQSSQKTHERRCSLF